MGRTFAIAVMALLLCYGVAAQDDNARIDAQVLDLPIPEYPAEARATGLAGQMRVNVAIDENGTVTGIRDVTGPDSICASVTRDDVAALREAAKTAALKARFLAATENGKPVASTLWVNYDFSANVGDMPAEAAASKIAKTIPKRVSGGVLNGKAKSLPKPAYPAAAKAVAASGSVSVQVLLETDGTVFSAQPVSGHPLLQAASATAACSARFSPTLLSGEPVKVTGIIVYNFVP